MKRQLSLSLLGLLLSIAACVPPLAAQEYAVSDGSLFAQSRSSRTAIHISDYADDSEVGYEQPQSYASTKLSQASNLQAGDGQACERQVYNRGGCGLSCSCTGPLWKGTADALFLTRSNPGSSILAFNTANPAESLNASAYDFGTRTGFDLSLTRQLNCDNAIELRYFGVDHWNARLSVATTPNSLYQVNAAVPIFTFSGSGVDTSYASALHSSEINGRRLITDALTVLAGFRYVELNEHLSANLVGSGIPFDYNASTYNRLYGFQMGGQVDLWNRKSFSLNTVGKAGIYGNTAGQGSTISTGLITLPTAGQANGTAFVGEIGLNGALRLTDHLALRSGYRLLWLEGVSLAGQQLAASDFTSGTGFDDSGDVFYHGAFTGLELTY